VAPGTREAAAAQAALQPMRESSHGKRWAVCRGWGQPFWRRKALQADKWRDMGAKEYEVRAICFGILDLPSIPFTSGVVLPAIPHKEEDSAFGGDDLRAGCGIYEEFVAEGSVWEVMRTGRMVSSVFVVWQGEGVERKGRFVINFSRQSQRQRLLPFPLWWTVLQVHCIAVWLGKVGALVYKADKADGQVHNERVAIPSAPMDRRFLCAPTDGRRQAIGRDCRRTRQRLDTLSGSSDSLGIRRGNARRARRYWTWAC
jgi:hypothetical protein